jgi:hypothetical protein
VREDGAADRQLDLAQVRLQPQRMLLEIELGRRCARRGGAFRGARRGRARAGDCPVPLCGERRRSRRLETTPAAYAPARRRNDLRLVAGRLARKAARAARPLGQFIRVTQGRSAAKCAPTRKTKKPLYIAGRTTLLQPAFAASMNGAGWEDEGISEAWLGDIKTFGGGRRTACLSDEAAGGRPRRRIRDWPICSLQLG